MQYDTGQVRPPLTLGMFEGFTCLQISDILLMSDFKLRFAHCNTPGDASSCEFSRVREGLIVSLLSIGTLIGALLGAPYVPPPSDKCSSWSRQLNRTADFFGRRNAMSLECAVFIVGVIIQVTTFSSWVQIMIGRFISGLGVGGLSAAVPMVRSRVRRSLSAVYHLANLQYQAETAPPQIRGAMT